MTEEADPIERFGALLARAEQTGMDDPNAMVLATVDANGRPSTRAVLLKGFDASGFVFYTNTQSRKGTQLADNPHVALTFYWRQLERQVHVEGRATRVDDAEADAYFATRDRRSCIGAWASDQSRPLKSRAQLLARAAKLEVQYLGRAVPRPPHWSGYRVVPDRIEFWTAGPFRLHDRTVYERTDDGWQHHSLFP